MITVSTVSVHFNFGGTVSVYTRCPSIMFNSSPFTQKVPQLHDQDVVLFIIHCPIYEVLCEKLLILFIGISHTVLLNNWVVFIIYTWWLITTQVALFKLTLESQICKLPQNKLSGIPFYFNLISLFFLLISFFLTYF